MLCMDRAAKLSYGTFQSLARLRRGVKQAEYPARILLRKPDDRLTFEDSLRFLVPATADE
jgi:hypothetical protein